MHVVTFFVSVFVCIYMCPSDLIFFQMKLFLISRVREMQIILQNVSWSQPISQRPEEKENDQVYSPKGKFCLQTDHIFESHQLFLS